MSKPGPDRRTRPQRPSRNGAEPWRRYLWKGRSDPEAIAFAKEAYERDQMALGLQRKLVNLSGLARFCRRRGCRRAGVCAGPECLIETGLPAEESPGDAAALRALYDSLKASVAAAGE